MSPPSDDEFKLVVISALQTLLQQAALMERRYGNDEGYINLIADADGLDEYLPQGESDG